MSVVDASRRVAIQHEIAMRADEYAVSIATTPEWERHTQLDDLVEGVRFFAGTQEQREALIPLAAHCQAWLEALAVEAAR